MRRQLAARRGVLELLHEVVGHAPGPVEVAGVEADLNLEELRGEEVLVVALQLAGARARLLELAVAVERVGHVVEAELRVRLGVEHGLEVGDGVLVLARRGAQARAQEERVGVLGVTLEQLFDLRASAGRVAALEADLAEAVAAARVVGEVLDDVLVEVRRVVEAPDRGVVVGEARAALGLVPVELRPRLISLLGAVELPVDEVVAGEHPAHVAVVGVDLDGLAELAFGLLRALRLSQELAVLDVRERRAVVDRDGLLVDDLGVGEAVHLLVEPRLAHVGLDALRVEVYGLLNQLLGVLRRVGAAAEEDDVGGEDFAVGVVRVARGDLFGEPLGLGQELVVLLLAVAVEVAVGELDARLHVVRVELDGALKLLDELAAFAQLLVGLRQPPVGRR